MLVRQQSIVMKRQFKQVKLKGYERLWLVLLIQFDMNSELRLE